MKYIKKGKPPQALKDWAKVNEGVAGVQYGTHGFPTADVKAALLKEQGSLCPYIMIPLNDASSHIEHIKPQAASRAGGALHETWDYANLLACYPGNDPRASGRDQFGATKKGEQWDDVNFVSPLTESCESRFSFSMDGRVAVRNSNDTGASWTIDALGLESTVLDEWRRAAIEGFGVSLTARNPLKKSEAEKLRKAISRRRDDGSFHGYCVAVEHAAAEYIALLDKREKKKQYAAKSRAAKGK